MFCVCFFMKSCPFGFKKNVVKMKDDKMLSCIGVERQRTKKERKPGRELSRSIG